MSADDYDFVDLPDEDYNEGSSPLVSRPVVLESATSKAKVTQTSRKKAFTRGLKSFHYARPDQALDDNELEERTDKLMSPGIEENDYMERGSPDDYEEDKGELTRTNPFNYNPSRRMLDYDFLDDESTCSFEDEVLAFSQVFGELEIEGIIKDRLSGDYEMVDRDDLRFPEAGLENAEKKLSDSISTHFSLCKTELPVQ